MALGPVRALLGAHAASVRNRWRREVNRNGAVLSVLALILFLATSIGPLLVGLALGGYVLGRLLPDPIAALTLGALGTALSLFGGAVGGTLGGTRQLSWESYRTFPLSRWHLLAAELIAGVGDLVPGLISLALLILHGGLAVARPHLTPLVALLAAEGIGLMLALQLIVGGAAAALVRRASTAAGALLAIGALGLIGARNNVSFDPAALGHRLLLAMEATPLGFASRGLVEAQHGRWGSALARHLYPLALLVALVALAGWILGRDLERDRQQSPVGPSGWRWRFHIPTAGVAELHLKQLLASSVGRAGLVMPLVTVVLVRGPLAMIAGDASWVIPASYAYTAIAAMSLQTSLFGLDGHGIKALLTLPVRADELLAGKVWALGVYQGAQLALLTLLLVVVRRPPWGELLAGALMTVAASGLMLTLGQFLSCWMPRPIARQAMQKASAPLPLAALSLLCWSLISSALGALHLGLVGSRWQLPVMGGAAAVSLLALRLSRGPAARYLDASREEIADRIGG